MTLQEAIEARHSVRKYENRPIEEEKKNQINEYIAQINQESGLHIQLVVNEPLAFSTGIFKYGQFEGVTNYLVLAGKKWKANHEQIGYYGEKVVLYMQTLGLSSCWVALTFKNIKEAYQLNKDEELKLVVACGYGKNDGVQHPQKKGIEHYATVSDPAITSREQWPEWFCKGMEAALLAPTAMNQQKFHFTLLPDNTVEAKAQFSLFGNTEYDLGIAKCNFEIGAVKENFGWKECEK